MFYRCASWNLLVPSSCAPADFCVMQNSQFCASHLCPVAVNISYHSGMRFLDLILFAEFQWKK